VTRAQNPSALSKRLAAWDDLRRPVWLFDPITCRGLYANAAALELWGAESRDELLARDFSQLSPAVRTRTERLALATANGETVTERWTFYPGDKPVTVQALISAFPLADGRSALLFEAAQVEATTEELRAVEALRHTSTLISLIEPTGETTFANPAAFAAYGDGGRRFADRFADPARGAEALSQVLAGAVLADLRQVRTADGERWHHLDARRVLDPVTGQASALLSERDVTAQIEAERALALAREQVGVAEAKQRFLANVSHELRTPLTAVTGFADLLGASGGLDPDQRAHLAHIREGGARLAEIINNIIDIADLDRGDIALDEAPFEPARRLQSLVDGLRPRAAERGLSLALDAPPGLADRLVGDAGRIAKIVDHYLSNALKWTSHGGVIVRLEIGDAGEAADVTISVIDTGPGIDARTQARLFQRFGQADDGVRKRVAGGGLGLAIARELAELMGGETGVESAPGRGARFWLRLRLPRAGAGGEAMPAEAIEDRPIRVLYADDHASNRALVQAILRSQGCVCDVVCDGAEAVAAVRDGVYDLVLMDIQMPVLDGVSAAREIRALPAPGASVPILALTANTLADQLRSYEAAGMQDWLAKPVVIADLIAKTTAWAGATMPAGAA
jgi:signal transduction histidine kinase/ActR/RegA family two-component response regulator